MKKESPRQLIIKLIKERAFVKLEVQELAKFIFNDLKAGLNEVVGDLRGKLEKAEKKIVLDIEEKSEFQINLRIGEDILIFVLHTNIYTFDKDHPMWKTSYLQDDPSRSYCGMIYLYNFLHDSFHFNRVNDSGYLIARILLNKEKHFFVEGKRQLGVLYNDFISAIATKEALAKVVESAILYVLDFDTYVPPYEEVKEISVQDMQDITVNMRIRTGKRMGFQFRIDETKYEGMK